MPLRWRHSVCFTVAIVLPVSLLGQDVAGAMLQSNGVGVLVNRYPAPASTALFAKDLVETQKGAVARLAVAGSTADVGPETMVEFDVEELVFDHGSLLVNTSHGLRVRVGCLTITPVSASDWTRYDIIDVNGQVKVKANQNDVYIDFSSRNPQQLKQLQRSGRDLVKQGEEVSRDEKCGGAHNPVTATSGVGAVLNSPWAVGTGFVGIGTVACLGLFCRDDDPVSPALP